MLSRDLRATPLATRSKRRRRDLRSMRADPELTHPAIHALNEWLHQTWTIIKDDRIYTAPINTLPNVEKAIAELACSHERGAKTVLIRPAPLPGSRGSRA